MPQKTPHSIAVIDVGATNAKVVHFAPDLSVLGERTAPVARTGGPPYLHLDPDGIIAFATKAIRAFDRVQPVDAIVPCTHGSALALVDAGGGLALPMMSYLAEVPGEVAAQYARIEPPFSEVLAPVNPGALTLARQLLWQEMRFADGFGKVEAIMPYAQYVAFHLSGVMAAERSALGAQTQLWAPAAGTYSSLARARGWDRLMAPLHPAGVVLGAAKSLRLSGRGAVHCGVHDSNANFFRYAGLAPLVLLSTGTWIIAFDSDAPLDGLDSRLDQASNTTVTGRPVACARFMGGEEYARIAGAGNNTVPDPGRVAALVRAETMALPSFTASGGPVPETGGKGRITGPAPETDADRAALAALYTAQMTALASDALGSTEKVVVDGPFAANAAFCGVLAALMPGRNIYRSASGSGTAAGAAALALAGGPPPPRLEPARPAAIDGLAAYHRRWRRAVDDLQSA